MGATLISDGINNSADSDSKTKECSAFRAVESANEKKGEVSGNPFDKIVVSPLPIIQ